MKISPSLYLLMKKIQNIDIVDLSSDLFDKRQYLTEWLGWIGLME